MAKDKMTYTDLSLEEIQEKIVSEKTRLQQLEMNHAVSTLENPMKIRESRRNIARLLTELQKRKNS